jgi:hypothetical protein
VRGEGLNVAVGGEVALGVAVAASESVAVGFARVAVALGGVVRVGVGEPAARVEVGLAVGADCVDVGCAAVAERVAVAAGGDVAVALPWVGVNVCVKTITSSVPQPAANRQKTAPKNHRIGRFTMTRGLVPEDRRSQLTIASRRRLAAGMIRDWSCG